MLDEITIKPKTESTASAPEKEDQSITLSRSHLIGISAVGLAVCFFLPWVNIFGATPSGFDFQKLGQNQLLLWFIPISCAITVIAAITKRSQEIAGQLTGVLHYLVGIYWYTKVGGNLFHILTYGGYLSLIFGAALLVLARKRK